MFNINDDNTISIVQGDTGVINLKIKHYPLTEGDRVRFMVSNRSTSKRSISSININTPLIEKLLTSFENDGTARIVITPNDTLDIAAGKYFYEIQVSTKTGIVDTVIPSTNFTILEGLIYDWS